MQYHTGHYPSWIRCVTGWKSFISLCKAPTWQKEAWEGNVPYRNQAKVDKMVWWRDDSRQGRFLSRWGKRQQSAGINALYCLWCKFSLESVNQREVDISPKETLLRLRKIKVHLEENLASQQWEQKLSPLGIKLNLSGATAKSFKGLKHIKAKILHSHVKPHVAWGLFSKKFGQVLRTTIARLLLKREKNWTMLQIDHLC